jgi:hypothetical protein
VEKVTLTGLYIYIYSILLAREKVTLTRLYFSSVINNGMICMDKDNMISIVFLKKEKR